MALSREIMELLACPACGGPLEAEDDRLTCADKKCIRQYPLLRGAPVLIDEERSIFSIEGIMARRTGGGSRKSALRGLLGRITPGRSLNFTSKNNYARLAALLTDAFKTPRVLNVGGGEMGRGMERLMETPSITILETDIQLCSRTGLICDANVLPFVDGSFHAVIIQGVLEFVMNPERCAAEIHRVLADGGFVYAETPFMQQMQDFPDMMRYSRLGHRRLFRWFEEVDSGPVAGPGTVLAWAWEFFLCGFSNNKRRQGILRRIARFTGLWAKYFDHLLLDSDASRDGASSNYFLGRKADKALSDHELVALFRRQG